MKSSGQEKNYYNERKWIKYGINKRECRFVTTETSKAIFERQSQKILDNIKQKVYELENSPSKKSNHDKALYYFFQISENPYLIIYSFGLSQKKEVSRNATSRGL